jgi:hypothetical protein
MNLAKKSKKELFELEAKLNSRKLVTDKSREQIKKDKQMIKHVLYECKLCAHAVIKTKNPGAWDESEYFVKDCGDRVCRYRGEFLKRAEQEDDGDKKVKEILNTCKVSQMSL